jgi:hypothetical protein
MTNLTPERARSIACGAYVYGVPLLGCYKTMYAFSVAKGNPQYKGPFNQVLSFARVFTPDDSAFVTPNADTPYSFASLDLRSEPMVIVVPKIEKNRYFVFQLMDLYTFNFAYIGSRSTGNAGGNYLIAGPQWNGDVPTGITRVFQSETQFVNVVGRTQLFNADDLDNVKKIQDEYAIKPLSAFEGSPPPPVAPEIAWIEPVPEGEDRSSLDVFGELAFLLQFAQPPHPSEAELRASFKEVGIVPGQPFDPSALAPEIRNAMKAGVADGQKQIDDCRASLAGKTDRLFGSREFLKNDFVIRATGTQVGIGANSRDEALYPILDRDAQGQPLDAGKHKYTLRFAKGELPPVNAFWSVTMYTLPQQLLTRNPINRYLVNSPMLPDLKLDADGSLTLYIQADSPDGDHAANWLPAPHGPFVMFMRFYWPKAELLDGSWTSPVVNPVV